MRRDNNDKPIHEILNSMSKKGPLKSGLADARIKKIWEEKIGKLLLTQTEKLYFAKGIIYIKITSAPLRHELQMGKAKLIEQFNKELGEDLVINIILN